MTTDTTTTTTPLPEGAGVEPPPIPVDPGKGAAARRAVPPTVAAAPPLPGTPPAAEPAAGLSEALVAELEARLEAKYVARLEATERLARDAAEAHRSDMQRRLLAYVKEEMRIDSTAWPDESILRDAPPVDPRTPEGQAALHAWADKRPGAFRPRPAPSPTAEQIMAARAAAPKRGPQRVVFNEDFYRLQVEHAFGGGKK